MKSNSWHKLNTILAKASQGLGLSIEETIFLLRQTDDEQIRALFQEARNLRRRHFGCKVFLYGFLYTTTYCRNNCSFCFFRKSNTACPRYRKEEQEILKAAIRLKSSGVHMIDLTMGEDPEYFFSGHQGFAKLVKLVESVKETTGLPIMVSPGVVPDRVLRQVVEAGATWYACYQETHQRVLFNQLRIGQDYDDRLRKKRMARSFGLLIEEGILSGVGESAKDIAESMVIMRHLHATQVRVMNFVPQEGTPMENWDLPAPQREVIIIAVMRLNFPDKLIPATLDVGGLAGLKQKLDAGANVITSLVPPGQGLAGVAESSLDIDDARRTTTSVLPVLESCGLKPGSVEEYVSWIGARRKELGQWGYTERIACQ